MNIPTPTEIPPPVHPNESKKRTKKPRQPQPPTKPKESFSEQLGNNLAEDLSKKAASPRPSLNLVDRLLSPQLVPAKYPKTDSDIALVPVPSKDGDIKLVVQGSTSSTESLPKSAPKFKPKPLHQTYLLKDLQALAAFQTLIQRHGKASHMGILDDSYTFFITRDRHAALYYKVKNRTAVVGGDPLCSSEQYPHILSEFATWRKKAKLDIAFLGAGQEFINYIRSKGWTTMCFGTERVLNPVTNPVLHSNAGKSITRTVRKLLDPKGAGLTAHVYTPSLGLNEQLQDQLLQVYEDWRDEINKKRKTQAYITVYELFALPDLMTYIYTCDPQGNPNGFAALRGLGATNGYHLDPYVAHPTAPKRITDLLLFSAMSLLSNAKVTYLSLGYEPLDNLGEIEGMPESLANLSRKVHRRIFRGLPIAGKKEYHDKFYPDEQQDSKLYLVFPPGIPSVRHMRAVAHFANIRIRTAVFTKDPKKVVGPVVKAAEKKGKEGDVETVQDKS